MLYFLTNYIRVVAFFFPLQILALHCHKAETKSKVLHDKVCKAFVIFNVRFEF